MEPRTSAPASMKQFRPRTESLTKPPAMMQPPEMIDWLDEMPVWAIAVWALGVWGAVLGSLLLLVRSRFAVQAFAASLIGLAVSTIHQAATKAPVGPMGVVIAIWVIAVFLMVYSVAMRRKAILR